MRVPHAVTIPRTGPVALFPFLKFFRGFEHVAAVQHTFGTTTSAATRKILGTIKVEFFSSPHGYMSVSDEDGHLLVSADYLARGVPIEIFLDVVHELVHVRQHRNGQPLFDESYPYHERPTELEAYRLAVDEARRLGMANGEIFNYLRAFWMQEEEVRILAKHCGIALEAKRGRQTQKRV